RRGVVGAGHRRQPVGETPEALVDDGADQAVAATEEGVDRRGRRAGGGGQPAQRQPLAAALRDGRGGELDEGGAQGGVVWSRSGHGRGGEGVDPREANTVR